ncbi:hypothetical protein Tco_0977764 [Tanacetum coccineum]|uniref:Uncharacterized protein n=1 Tax=Tanacetum coccineum TaxID=301880 RepID=A0ABQ5ELF1_9ASTR
MSISRVEEEKNLRDQTLGNTGDGGKTVGGAIGLWQRNRSVCRGKGILNIDIRWDDNRVERVITAAGGRSYKENSRFKRKVATDLEAVMMISRGLGKDMF